MALSKIKFSIYIYWISLASIQINSKILTNGITIYILVFVRGAKLIDSLYKFKQSSNIKNRLIRTKNINSNIKIIID